MYKNKKITVVMPAYNAEKTLRQAFTDVCEQDIVDTVIIVDDCSRDDTIVLAEEIKNKALRQSGAKAISQVIVHRHEQNKGYGGNQKSCYKFALEHGADIVIMVHPDCQYTPKLIPAMASMIANGLHPCVLGSRILGGYALKGGMPIWKYVANRVLTLAMNILFGAKLSEYHTGYRAFSRELLEKLPLEENMDDFAFDAQMLAEILWAGASIGEVSCPTVYFEDASSISFARSCTYGIGCLKTAMLFRLCKWGVMRSKKFERSVLMS
jgi:glycosyltransferase involved in cell wall biosynthesis